MKDADVPNLRGMRVYVYGYFADYNKDQISQLIRAVGGIPTAQPSRKDDYTVYGFSRDPEVQPQSYPNTAKVMTLRQLHLAIERTNKET